MDVIRVVGGRPISGEVTVEGAKNSALKLMAASIMAPGVTTLQNVPNIADVHVMGKVLKRLGAKIKVASAHELVIDTSNVSKWETPYDLVAQMRASTAVLGPLIARFGRAVVAMPGGCNIGARKIDMHILGLEALGVHFEIDHGNIHASTPDGLHGAEVALEFASVGATENLMMASVAADGTTVIDNAAREPEIVDLANMLNEMGAKVRGAGSPRIEIEGVGVDALHPVEHRVIGDRIEAGTFLAAGAICGGPVTVRGFDPEHLGLVLKKMEAMDISIERGDDWCTARRDGPIRSVDIQTLPYPGFPTDMQAQTFSLLGLGDGTAIVTENIFENRFMFASELVRMGAQVTIEGHHAIVRGVPHYSGAEVRSTDLRGGAALVIAGLEADGYTTVSNIHHIDRGYERFVEKLQGLGADVARVTVEGTEE
ncbi:MAG: UDP-N-acetylglucosamine 1-carboxyvinyltransferase [Atopobiaceae bacterium]|jgi:UDP-N-acetylglucosamine 1-carboxyvinyltransferase|nr:UDP-N-acetylglucosamine 1-carboxyvinyltransferase [Atopobiaceae bacterium]MCH4119810.1 UDP-N-acetylglucosamine 1-carboxyvinyltransferase [Atopobiaceae bacterium]MCI1318204.1 UDP-N-acetylglucosamine 1-carboxyvinyltransferase [Atopobiaceae bacterium]MCI1389091.1 UDP-N-acetylglucosamine 1-carboxyvinyltransferase [Atopobiaceae bacterium]MCI1432898.1 UDP-N-acetylglucosamine 1-carboxyvinyltransferase [Atopobiaceae bacterium]